MAIVVKVNGRDPGEILEIVRELRKQGLEQSRDFNFAYMPYHWDQFSGEETARHAVFTFHTEKYAILFTLKYGS